MKMRNPVALIVLVYATLLSSHPALAQFSQQGPKLVGTGGVGYSVSLSRDGNTAIVGGSTDNGQTGAAWIWTRSAGVWIQGTKLVSSDSVGAQQGRSVSLSADGKTAIVGGPADKSNAGAAWVWTRSGEVWTQETKLFGLGAVGPAHQGYSVSLSADGNTAIVGGYFDSGQAGAAWVWTRSAGVWTQESKLFGSGAVGAAWQGFSVSLSADGNTAIVGGITDKALAGAAWVWTRSGGVWTQETKLFGSGAVGVAHQGFSVSLSADGNTALVGGSYDNSNAGAAWVWTRSGGIWTQETKLFDSGAVGNAFQGFSVSLSRNGDTALIGGPADNSTAGAAWVWTRRGGIWSPETKLFGSGAVGTANQGYSVSLSADGNTAIVGGPVDNGGAGAAWVFVNQAAGQVVRRRAVAPEPSVPLSLLGARNFTGQYPTPNNVIYTDKNGQDLTALAYPGQVFLVVSPLQMNLAATLELVQINGGSVMAQIPTAGLYWVQVATGSEATFINGVKFNSAVIYVAPHVPLTTAQSTTAMVDLSGASSLTPLVPGNNLIAQFDQFRLTPSNNVCGFSHGVIVDQFLEQGGQRATTYDVTQYDHNTNRVAVDAGLTALSLGSDVGFGTLRAAEGALHQGQKLIVNVSLQSNGQPKGGLDPTSGLSRGQVCETETPPKSPVCFGPDGQTYASWKSDEFAFLVGVASGLEWMRDDLRNNTLVVVSAGNAGLDLTRELALLREFMPRAFSHMLVVGSLDSDGQPFAGHNYALHDDRTNSTNIIYAPGVDVAAPITGGCSPSGTSFAAPQIANLAAQIAQRFPGTTTAQIVTAINTAAPHVNGFLTMPTIAQVANVLAPAGGPPTVSFAASPATITPGQSSTLSWTTTNATSVSISGVPGSQPASGSVFVSPAATTTYTLTATGPGGMTTAMATVTVSAVSSFTLTVATTGTGGGTVTSSPAGIVCSATCSASFASSASVTLTATPATASTFGGWSGGGCSGTGSCTVTMNSDKTVTATFNLTTAVGQYDGTYDFSFVINHNGTPETTVLLRYFIVLNGVISSSDAQLSGSVLDNFGNVRFSGPCPVNPSGAVFTGTLNAGNPKFGQGTWLCGDGITNSWRVYNGY